MSLRVVGAGVGRTGTASLQSALATLLGEPCYHMREVFSRPEHVGTWHAAARGDAVDWPALLSGYAAAVDWPASAYWRELSAAFPDALVLLSVREPERWWDSADETIFPTIRDRGAMPEAMLPWHDMVMEMLRSRFTDALDDRAACLAAFERHNEDVRAAVPAERLLEWTASDGWGPICQALGLPVPATPFPRTNTREEWRERAAPAETP